MSKTVEIFWNDLSVFRQKEIAEAIGQKDRDLNLVKLSMNWDIFPIATIELDLDED